MRRLVGELNQQFAESGDGVPPLGGCLVILYSQSIQKVCKLSANLSLKIDGNVSAHVPVAPAF